MVPTMPLWLNNNNNLGSNPLDSIKQFPVFSFVILTVLKRRVQVNCFRNLLQVIALWLDSVSTVLVSILRCSLPGALHRGHIIRFTPFWIMVNLLTWSSGILALFLIRGDITLAERREMRRAERKSDETREESARKERLSLFSMSWGQDCMKRWVLPILQNVCALAPAWASLFFPPFL